LKRNTLEHINQAPKNNNPNSANLHFPITESKKKKCEIVCHTVPVVALVQLDQGRRTNIIQNIVNPTIPKATFCFLSIGLCSVWPNAEIAHFLLSSIIFDDSIVFFFLRTL